MPNTVSSHQILFPATLEPFRSPLQQNRPGEQNWKRSCTHNTFVELVIVDMFWHTAQVRLYLPGLIGDSGAEDTGSAWPADGERRFEGLTEAWIQDSLK